MRQEKVLKLITLNWPLNLTDRSVKCVPCHVTFPVLFPQENQNNDQWIITCQIKNREQSREHCLWPYLFTITWSVNSSWLMLCTHDGAAIVFIFYTYLFSSVLFKAWDLKCCLLLGTDMFATRVCFEGFAQQLLLLLLQSNRSFFTKWNTHPQNWHPNVCEEMTDKVGNFRPW